MEKLYHIIIAAAVAATSAGVSAQGFDGAMDVSAPTVTYIDGKVLLEMTITVDGDAVGKCHSIAVAPVISEGANEAVFPYVLVNGRKQRQQFERRSKFRFTELTQNPPYRIMNIDRRNRGGIIGYSAEIPRQDWMQDASLNMRFVLLTCSGERQVYTAKLAAAVAPAEKIIVQAPEPIVRPAPEPQYVSGCAYIIFKPDSADILYDHMQNARELAEINRQLSGICNDPNIEITKLDIVGYASPEARFSRNESLALARMKTFSRYLTDRYGIPAYRSSVSAVAEDWHTLRKFVAESNMAAKREVLAIIDSGEHPDVKESRLRKLNGGTAWRELLDDMFPKLRRVEYRVEYRVTPKQ